jgi:hypothetical protein
MRLVKLAAYALLGYALYEFVRGILDDRGGDKPAAKTPPARNGPRRARRPTVAS